MRLLSYRTATGEVRAGVLLRNVVVDANRAYAALLRSEGRPRAQMLADALVPSDLRALLEGGEASLEALREAVAFVERGRRRNGKTWLNDGTLVRANDVNLAAPIMRPGKILCLGLNYRDHAEESGAPLPPEPIVFAKASTAVIGPGDPIRIPKATRKVDYEVELAAVIGRPCKEVAAAEAMDYVVGYTILNDVSARDYQLERQSGQWLLGKSFDTFCPIGPWIVTKDEIADPHALDIKLRLNGRVMQHSNTRNLIFTIPQIIEYVSQVFTLEPGDIISTGTPGGVGFARKPPRYLKPGDVCRLDIEGIGTLENPVAK